MIRLNIILRNTNEMVYDFLMPDGRRIATLFIDPHSRSAQAHYERISWTFTHDDPNWAASAIKIVSNNSIVTALSAASSAFTSYSKREIYSRGQREGLT